MKFSFRMYIFFLTLVDAQDVEHRKRTAHLKGDISTLTENKLVCWNINQRFPAYWGVMFRGLT